MWVLYHRAPPLVPAQQPDAVDSVLPSSGRTRPSPLAFLSRGAGQEPGQGDLLTIFLSFLFHFLSSPTLFFIFSIFPLGNRDPRLRLWAPFLSPPAFLDLTDFSFPFGNCPLLLSTHCHQNQFVQTNRLISAAEMSLRLLPMKQIKNQMNEAL